MTRPRLTPTVRKTLLTIHITTAVGLVAVHAAILTLAIAGRNEANPLAVYPAALTLATWLLLPLAALSWISGVSLGLLTPWGIFKHWWITIKFTINTIGLGLAVLRLVPELRDAAQIANRGIKVGEHMQADLVQSSTGATVVLTIAVVLSVFKPFGRVRRNHTRPATADRQVQTLRN